MLFRSHRLAFILYGDLLVTGTVSEVVRQSNLTTWAVTGPDLMRLSERLLESPGVEQAVAFGSALHVSGDDQAALDQAIAPFRTAPYEWRRVEAGLEDVFIHLMEKSKGGRSS